MTTPAFCKLRAAIINGHSDSPVLLTDNHNERIMEVKRDIPSSGFFKRQLELRGQFYRCYPIANALCSQLNWFQYRLLIYINDADKREYYQLEAEKNGSVGW